MAKIYIVPKPLLRGILINPDSKQKVFGVVEVDKTQFWLRRLRDGDVKSFKTHAEAEAALKQESNT